MQVFVTGGTGLIGSAVVAELLGHGHTISALARSEKSESALRAAGAEPVRGGIADLDVLRKASSDADAVIHLAFNHDFSTAEAVARSVEEEGAAIAAMGEQLVGTDRPYLVVSGTPWLAGRVSSERDVLVPDGPVAGRIASVNDVLTMAGQGVRTAAVRMPRTVHNNGDGGFAGILTETARQTRVSGYLGDGTQRWPAVHALDAATLFRLVLEGLADGTVEPGTAWHAVDDEGDAMRDIAEVIGRRLGVPVEQVADDAFGPMSPIFAMDQPSSSAHTRATLGWQPTHPSLLRDLENIEHVQP